MIEAGKFYRYKYDGSKLLALREAKDIKCNWRYFSFKEDCLMFVYAADVEPWTDPPPAPKLVTWYRVKAWKHIGDTQWSVCVFWSKTEADALNKWPPSKYETYGLETCELPE